MTPPSPNGGLPFCVSQTIPEMLSTNNTHTRTHMGFSSRTGAGAYTRLSFVPFMVMAALGQERPSTKYKDEPIQGP